MPRLILLQQILPGQQKDTSWLCLCSQLDFGPCSWEPEAAAGSLHPHSAAWKQAGQAKHAQPQSWEAEPARGRGRELRGWALWDPLTAGAAHSPATAGNSKLTLSPVPSAESSLHPGVTSPAPGLPPAAPSGAVLEAGTHTQRLSPSTREEKTPSRQTRAAPSLPPSSHNPDFYWPLLLQTSQGWAFTPLRERVSPNLPCTASHSSSPSPGAAECRRSCRSPRGFHHPALPQVWQLLKWVRPASENKEKQSNFVLALN